MAKQTEDFKYRGRSGVVKALTTAMQDILTAGADGSDVTEFTIVLNGSTARSVTIEVSDGTTTAIITLISVAINSGNSTTNPAIDLINGGSIAGIAQLPGIERIGTLNILPLPAGWKLRAKQDVGTDCLIIAKQKDY
jgi:hypothetical protein